MGSIFSTSAISSATNRIKTPIDVEDNDCCDNNNCPSSCCFTISEGKKKIKTKSRDIIFYLPK